MECEVCKKDCERKSPRQKYCKQCLQGIRKQYEAKRRKTDKRIKWREEYKETYRERKRKYDTQYYQDHKKKHLKYSKQYREGHKEECKMRDYALKIFKNKLLKRANYKCEKCDRTENLQLHHKEYTQRNKKEFDEEDMKKIEVLCPICHKREHIRLAKLKQKSLHLRS